ncbi:hypothetical protein DFQ28_002811 [Apophysomyces sp. BC1034]|nr:hypothetical protein DFQ29_004796 [Apophysomyces sp. BC1021]KAG0189867.1 hypothetical protein DFQ28_002811 [Apophysomyces sp. BC1034]
MFEFCKAKVKDISSKLWPRDDNEEFQGLLQEDGADRLDVYAEGAHDNYNIVYWRFEGSMYEETFQNHFSTYYTMTGLISFVVVLWRRSKSDSEKEYVLPSLITNIVVFGIIAVTVKTDLGGAAYFWLALSLLVLTAITTSAFQVSVFANASRFPPKYMQAVMSGQGVAGASVALSSIMSALAGSTKGVPDEAAVADSALIYFLSALVITTTALIGRFVVNRQAFYIRHMKIETSTTHASLSENEFDEDMENPGMFFESESSNLSVTGVVLKSRGLLFSVAYVFFITLAVFPSITALIKSVARHDPSQPSDPAIAQSHNRFFDDDIFVAFHFLLFNVGDLVGRTVTIMKSLRTYNTKAIVIMSLARTVFIPAFLVCNVVVSSPRQWTVLIRNDLVYFLVVWLFAVTNGWIGSLAMMAAPQQEHIRSSAEKSLIGSVMSFSMVAGLAIGGLFSFVVRGMV